MNQKTKQIIIAVVVLIVVFIAFKYFFGSKTTGDETLTADNTTAQFVDGQAILTLLDRLNKVTLNDKVFASVVFNSLVDFSQPIDNEVAGRPNPFAPIGVTGSNNVSRATTTTTITPVNSR